MAELLTLYVITSIVLFIFGIAAGWHFSQVKEDTFTKANLRIGVGILVTIMWAISIGAEILIPAYTVSVLVHGIMGAVVGYLFSDDGITFNIGGE